MRLRMKGAVAVPAAVLRRSVVAVAVAAMAVVTLPLAQSQAAGRAAGTGTIVRSSSGVTVQKFGGVVYDPNAVSCATAPCTPVSGGNGNPLQLKLDVYVPQGPGMSGPWPAIVMLHGGGWGDGTRND